jgi:hypothetical protein
VIIRNLRISNVLGSVGPALTLEAAENIWLDHLDVSSTRTSSYDMLLRVTNEVYATTITHSKFFNANTGSVIGNPDTEDCTLCLPFSLHRLDPSNEKNQSSGSIHKGHVCKQLVAEHQLRNAVSQVSNKYHSGASDLTFIQ